MPTSEKTIFHKIWKKIKRKEKINKRKLKDDHFMAQTQDSIWGTAWVLIQS